MAEHRPDPAATPSDPAARPLTPAELRAEQRKIVAQAILALIVCTMVLAGLYLLLPRYFAFPEALPERLAFALQADVFVLLWIMLGMRLVARGRFRSAADNRGSAYAPPSPAIAVPVAFLQNTLEQAVMAVGAHLALATLLRGPELALIVGAVVLFGLGRLTFLFGYRKGASGRAFGIVTTVLPTLGGYALALTLMVIR